MSRSGYVDDGETWDMIRWRGAVASAIRGKRGQAFLKELLHALDSMEKKELYPGHLEKDNCFCALGVVGHTRGLDMSKVNPEDWESTSDLFGLADAMTREIVWENDESWYAVETPRHRWSRMRLWVLGNIKKESDG